VSRGSDVFSQNKRRSMAHGGSENRLKVAAAEDAQSVITVERLRRFNDIQGTVAGTVQNEIAAREYELAEPDLEAAQGEEGYAQQNQDADDLEARDEERDEVLSQMM